MIKAEVDVASEKNVEIVCFLCNYSSEHSSISTAMTLLYAFGIIFLIAGIWLAYTKHIQQHRYEQLLRDLKQQCTPSMSNPPIAMQLNQSKAHFIPTEPMFFSPQIVVQSEYHSCFLDELMAQIDYQLSPSYKHERHVMVWIPASLKDQVVEALQSSAFSESLYDKIDHAISKWIVLDSLSIDVQYLPRYLISTEEPYDVILKWKINAT